MLLGMLPLAAGAADDKPTSGTCGENVTWTVKNGVLTISGKGAMNSYSNVYFYIPWHDYFSDIQRIVIKSGVTSIGDYAFWPVTAAQVELADSVKSIGYCAMPATLTEIHIPKGVTKLCAGAVGGPACTKITVDAANSSYCSIDGVVFD